MKHLAICSAVAVLAFSFGAFAQTNETMLPPTVTGGTTVCPAGSSSLLTMTDSGASGAGSAINCVPGATLDNSGNLTVPSSVTIGGQTAVNTSIQTINTLTNLAPCPSGQVLTKTDATTYSCVAGSVDNWVINIAGMQLRAIGKYDSTAGTFSGHIYCGPAQFGIGASVNCGDHGQVETYCGSSSSCAANHAGVYKYAGITGQYYENVSISNAPISSAVLY